MSETMDQTLTGTAHTVTRAADPGARDARAGAPGARDLRAHGLTRTVGGRRDRKVLVDDAGFTLPDSGVVALVGPNGAGKSSLLRLLAGTTESATAAQVLLGDEDLLALRRRERAKRVALVEQELRAEFALTVRQVVEMGRIPHESAWGPGAESYAVVKAAMARTGALPWADRMLSTLSGGEQQRVQMARALAQEPDLLLLDEPTNHLDVRAQLDALGLLREVAADGVRVVAALHDLNLAAAHCDHVVVLAAGRVRAVGTIEDVLDADLVEDVYGVRADVLRHPRTGRPLIAFS